VPAKQPRKVHYVYCHCMLNFRLTDLDGFVFSMLIFFLLLGASLQLYRLCVFPLYLQSVYFLDLQYVHVQCFIHVEVTACTWVHIVRAV
jgi:hypothetical protein